MIITFMRLDAVPANPFRPGSMLLDSAVLPPGREPEVNELLALIESRSPAVVTGHWRSGKTSILRHVAWRLSASGSYVVRFVSCQGRSIKTADDLARVLEPELMEAVHPAEEFRGRLRSNRSVLILDEVIGLASAEPGLFAWIRAIAQEEVSVVFAGTHYDWTRVVDQAATLTGNE